MLARFLARINGDLTGNLSTFILATVVGGLVTFVVLDSLFSDGEFAPLGGYNVPQPIAENVIPVGGNLVTTFVVKCNESDETVSVSGNKNWRRLDNGGQLVIPVGGGTMALEPGCLVRGSPDGDPPAFTTPLPPEVGPGVWIYQGQDCAKKGSQEHCVNWQTKPFTVEAAP